MGNVLPAQSRSRSREGVKPFKFKHKGKQYEYLYIEDEKGLLELIQMGAIEIHPWGATIDAIDTPDRLIFDSHPAPTWISPRLNSPPKISAPG